MFKDVRRNQTITDLCKFFVQTENGFDIILTHSPLSEHNIVEELRQSSVLAPSDRCSNTLQMPPIVPTHNLLVADDVLPKRISDHQ